MNSASRRKSRWLRRSRYTVACGAGAALSVITAPLTSRPRGLGAVPAVRRSGGESRRACRPVRRRRADQRDVGGREQARQVEDDDEAVAAAPDALDVGAIPLGADVRGRRDLT